MFYHEQESGTINLDQAMKAIYRSRKDMPKKLDILQEIINKQKNNANG